MAVTFLEVDRIGRDDFSFRREANHKVEYKVIVAVDPFLL